MVSNTSGGESRNPTTQSEILPGEGRSPSKQQSNTTDKLPPKALRNIVIFGESGVGKSSLINACAGESVAQTSSGASGCTFEYSRYEITIGNETFGIWDTIGLDEGSYGRVPATQAEDNLKKLLHDLAKASGVDLLVYCVRGARMRKALQRNYTLFHSAICRKKVPIALVVTGLENHEGDMESWWKDNGHEFQKLNMHFCGHACVTTLNQAVVPSSLLRTRCEHSRDTIRRLIADSVHAKEWRAAERTWMDAVMADVRGMLGPGEEGEDRFPNLILCDITSDIINDAPPNRSRKDSTTKDRTINLQNPVVFHAKITNPVSFQSPVTFNLSKRDTSSMMPFDFHRSEIGGKTFNIFRVRGAATGPKSPKRITKSPADFLVFVVNGGSADARDKWEHFYVTYGGDVTPHLMIYIGDRSQAHTDDWWNGAFSPSPIPRGKIVFVPEAEVDENRVKLQLQIAEMSLDCKESTKRHKKPIFGKRIESGGSSGDGEVGQYPHEKDQISMRQYVWEIDREGMCDVVNSES